ncbi:MAG: hypothetical protein H7Z42_02920, partial [Roseiflexaceae bacterium]|nr:hypothetical protein [Roseiflexaceae bacterium]
MDGIRSFLQLMSETFRVIGQALLLRNEVFEAALSPQLRAPIITLAILAGASLLIGESVVLFVNRVPPWRCAISLLINIAMTIVGWALWAALIWLVARAFGLEPAFDSTVRLVMLSHAPFVFGIFILA